MAASDETTRGASGGDERGRGDSRTHKAWRLPFQLPRQSVAGRRRASHPVLVLVLGLGGLVGM